MSPSLVGGPSHNRGSSVGGATFENTNGSNSTAARGGGRTFAHLEDLVSVIPDVDLRQPIRSILAHAESTARQAETHVDFGKPDIGLQYYIKASIIATEIIPRHKDWVDIQANKGEAYRLYQALTKRLNSQHQKFADVKRQIKEDNDRTGTRPARIVAKVATTNSSVVNGHTRAQSVNNQPLSDLSNGISKRQKPPIQPKPDALHGNVLPQSSDLAARFAGLRSGTNGKVQDPRIRTQSIPGVTEISVAKSTQPPLGRPSGPREMPSVPTSIPGVDKLPRLDVQIPNLPRAPDAIYSPAQNADTPATANLLSSVQRGGSFSTTLRQNAAPPISTYIPTPKILENGSDYFFPGPPLPPKKVIPSIPDSTTVTAEDLMSYLSYGSATLKVLLVDVRSRDDFENGHILTQSIICVEPITLRQGISAEQLGDSMIIAPDSEQALYEQRHEYDLIVYYDQSSTSLQDTGSSVVHFAKAIYDYEYDQKPKRHPMLLIGGLDAWTDLLGPNSLQSSISRTSSPAPDTFGKPGRPLGRVPPARKPPGPPLRRKKTYSSRPLSKEEENKWDQILRRDSVLVKESVPEEEESETAEFVYAKTTADFFRRYPELPAVQESMVTPLPREKRIDSVSSAPALPEVPARPAPALPRQYSSGLFEKGPVAVASPSQSLGITKSRRPQGLTGLNNSGVTCYLNSAVQAISATPFLRETLMQFSQSRSAVPSKSDEDPTVQPPQFLTKTLQNLLNHLWSGNQDFLKPTTFADYVNRVHSGRVMDQRIRALAYGGNGRQHDSAEFLNFLLEILDDELNPRRNLPEPKTDDPRYESQINKKPFNEAADIAWNYLTAREQSPITKKLKGMVGHVSICPGCKFESKTFELFTYLNLTIPDDRRQYTITSLIRENFGREETISDYTCDNCKEKHNCIRKDVLCYLPDYLIIELNRYNTAQVKLHNPVNFPERGLELPAISCSPSSDPNADRRRRGPFTYDTYGVTMHVGDSIGKGHYYTLARSLDKPNVMGSPGKWHEFNDVHVIPREFSATQGKLATILFLKRSGVP